MVSLGAMGDSYYEYLLKVWIYKGRRKEDEMYRAMWERAMDEMLRKLLFKNEESGYTYVAEFARCSPHTKGAFKSLLISPLPTLSRLCWLPSGSAGHAILHGEGSCLILKFADTEGSPAR